MVRCLQLYSSGKKLQKKNSEIENSRLPTSDEPTSSRDARVAWRRPPPERLGNASRQRNVLYLLVSHRTYMRHGVHGASDVQIR